MRSDHVIGSPRPQPPRWTCAPAEGGGFLLGHLLGNPVIRMHSVPFFRAVLNALVEMENPGCVAHLPGSLTANVLENDRNTPIIGDTEHVARPSTTGITQISMQMKGKS